MFYAQKREIGTYLRHSAKFWSGNIAGLFPFSTLLHWSQEKILLPFYHLVSDHPCPHIDSLYAVRNQQLFERDLDFLLQHYQPIDLQRLIAITKGAEAMPTKPVMHLSFDDGLRECAEIIAPILLRKGIPATFFLNAAFLDNRALMFRYKVSLCLQALAAVPKTQQQLLLQAAQALFGAQRIEQAVYAEQAAIDQFAIKLGHIDFEDFLATQRPYMSSEQVQSLLQQGFSIGSHSIDHPLYRQIDLQEQIRQTIESQRFLNETFHIPYKVFAFPFTDDGVGKKFFQKILEEEKFDLTFGGAGLKQDEIAGHLQRFPMEGQQLSSARRMLGREYLYYLLKKPLGKNKLYRKAS